MTAYLTPVLTDRSALAGLIPMVRRWYDCENGYGVSTVDGGDGGITIAAGLWMDRRPGWLQRLLHETEVLHCTEERVHVGSDVEALDVVRYVAALPPLGSELPPRRLLPECSFWWCVERDWHAVYEQEAP